MVSRRKFLELGVATAAAAAYPGTAPAASRTRELKSGGENYSHLSGTKRKGIPTACGLCVSRCASIGYVERGRIVKMEGNPQSVRTLGGLCGRGQAGILQAYDPDRILYPMKRAGARGEGKWKRISWDEALDELAGRMRKLRDEGTPEKFMFHHGWISASAEKLITKVFLPAYGTATIATSLCVGQGARFIAHELTWGGAIDNWDIDKTNYILNFGSNLIEAHTNHTAHARRLATGLVDRHLTMRTFDVRLSNTAAKSDTWIPIRPGTDLAVILAMCRVIVEEGLYRGEGEKFLEFCKVTENASASLEEKIAALKKHLGEYTPEWAHQISGVDAELIRDIAIEFATIKPACVISSRGATAHFNGAETERATQMLAALTGNIDNPGGRCLAVLPQWRYPTGPKDKPEPRKLDVLDGFVNASVLATHGVGHQVLEVIRNGRNGRPEIYMWYTYNPVYANPHVAETIAILKDESIIPFTVCVTPFYDESAALADMILPDATYLERYDFEDGFSPDQVPEFYIRQPLVRPPGEARDFKDVCCKLAKMLDIPLGFKSGKDFVKKACKLTPEIRDEAGGFRGMRKRGLWRPADPRPAYYSYRKPVDPRDLAREGLLVDQRTGVYWDWIAGGAASLSEARRLGYQATPGAFRGYIGQGIGDKVYAGFRPDQFNKSGYFEIHSDILHELGLPALPSYAPIPDHEWMKEDQMVLTTYKVNVQTLSMTQNCKWLTEIYYDNPAWINEVTANQRGIANGDRIVIRSSIAEIEATAWVTQTIVPGTIALSTHCGRWEYGYYASGKKAPSAEEDLPDMKLKWWKANGTHPNWIIPHTPDPISGQQSWMDTVVTVTKAGSPGSDRQAS